MRLALHVRAQSLVELSLVVPVLLIMLLGMIDLGRAFVYGVAVEQGAHEGARLASTASLDANVTDSIVVQRFIQASAPAITDCGTTLNTPQQCGGGTWTFTLTVTSGSSSYSSLANARSGQPSLSGSRVEVKGSGSVAMFAGVFTGPLGLSQISVQGDAVMVIV
jgi:Flp pilus assembly protein TadG